ncbi:hypothetical protein BurMR1_0930 [Burkholderia sp. MR1]|nr:hypothetical protein BurMR1_0930 [Burkholderia sp. MR1]
MTNALGVMLADDALQEKHWQSEVERVDQREGSEGLSNDKLKNDPARPMFHS